jgi:hypothetical protein
MYDKRRLYKYFYKFLDNRNFNRDFTQFKRRKYFIINLCSVWSLYNNRSYTGPITARTMTSNRTAYYLRKPFQYCRIIALIMNQNEITSQETFIRGNIKKTYEAQWSEYGTCRKENCHDSKSTRLGTWLVFSSQWASVSFNTGWYFRRRKIILVNFLMSEKNEVTWYLRSFKWCLLCTLSS